MARKNKRAKAEYHQGLDFDPKKYKSEANGLRKTKYLSNSLAHRTTWLRSDF